MIQLLEMQSELKLYKIKWVCLKQEQISANGEWKLVFSLDRVDFLSSLVDIF